MSGPRPFLDRVAQLPQALLLGAAMSLFLVLSLWAMTGESATFDEAIHLSAGYSHLVGRDFRMNPEHPPLAKVLSALPLAFLSVREPADRSDWTAARQGAFGYRLLYQSGNDPDRLLFWARIPTLFWGLLLIGTVYSLSRELYGPSGGLISLVLAAACPTLLAHGHLVTTDVSVTALMLLVLAAFRRLTEEATIGRSLACGILLGGALTAKYSATILVPVLGWLGILAWLRVRKSAAPARAWLRRAICAGLLAYSTLTTVWAVYDFRSSMTSGGSRDLVVESSGPLGFASAHRVLPSGYLVGFAQVQAHASQGHPAYALGAHSERGWRWYFPFAFLVKTPLPTLILMGWGLVALLRRRSGGGDREDFLLIPLIVYWVLSISSGLNIGVRHLLPVLALSTVIAGGVLRPEEEGRRAVMKRRGVIALLGGTLASVLAASPFFLPYFNEPALLAAERHGLLADSNLDWGQDLARLKRHLDRHGIAKVKLGYFGDASPRHLGLAHEVLPGSHSYTLYEPEWLPAKGVAPGDWVAVSASGFVGLGLEDPEYYRKLLGSLRPVARVGRSILLFRIP